MIINESAWHYKLYRLSYWVWGAVHFMPSNTNLCAYVRHMILGLLGCLMFWGLIGFAVGVLLCITAIGIYHHPFIALSVAGITAAVMGLFYLVYQMSSSGLVHDWIDAKTKGICPVITFKKDDHVD